MNLANIIPRRRLNVRDALITRFVLDYRVRVCVNQSGDCRFFLASNPNRQILVDAVRVNAHAARLIMYKLRYQTFRFYFRFSLNIQ
jgi:hypothetical protein